MTSNRHRPTFRVSPPGRGGTRVISERAKIFSHHQLAPPQLTPTMHIGVPKIRNIDQSSSALNSLNQLNIDSDDGGGSPRPPQDLIKERLKREKFQEFAARMMKTSSDDGLSLGPEIHAALLSMANGIDPMLGQERKRQLQRNLKERLNSGTKDDVSEHVPVEDETSVKVDTQTGVTYEPQFLSKFGNGKGRASLVDMESFQKRNRMWKSTIKSTLNFLKRDGNSSDRESKHVDKGENSSAPESGRSVKKQNPKNKIMDAVKPTSDMDRVLQRGSILLMASSALKPKARSKPKEPVEPEKVKEPIQYIPASFAGKFKTGAQRLPIYDRIDSKRKNVLAQGFPFESLESEISGAVRDAAREMKKSFGGNIIDKRPSFDGIKISALVGNNAATVQGFRQKKAYAESDKMNPFQLKLVQGLEDGELSSFLENHGRRNPGIGMQIIPGRAPDPGVSQGGKSPYRPTWTKPRSIPSEAAPLEPKFRKLPKTVMSRVEEGFGGTERQETPGISGIKGFPNFETKRNSIREDKKQGPKKIDLNYGNPRIVEPGIESIKKLSFMDITKSEFLREMRNHQNEFQLMKSKDEMRKSFPKTYVFPRKGTHYLQK